MVKVTQKLFRKFTVEGECISSKRTDMTTRDVKLMLDEPEAVGGTNLSFTPVEGLVATLIGCTNVITHKIAKENNIPIDAMSVDVDATLDRRGTSLTEEIDVPLPEMTLRINISTSADDDQIAILKRDLPKFCPISKVIRQSGTDLEEIWTIDRP